MDNYLQPFSSSLVVVFHDMWFVLFVFSSLELSSKQVVNGIKSCLLTF